MIIRFAYRRNNAAEGLLGKTRETPFGRWRAARAVRPFRAYGFAGRRRQWARTCTRPCFGTLCLRSLAGTSVVGCSSLSSIRTRPDLASIVMLMRFIALVFDSGPMGGFESTSASVKKYRVSLLPKKYSVKVLMPNLRRLSLNRIANN